MLQVEIDRHRQFDDDDFDEKVEDLIFRDSPAKPNSIYDGYDISRSIDEEEDEIFFSAGNTSKHLDFEATSKPHENNLNHDVSDDRRSNTGSNALHINNTPKLISFSGVCIILPENNTPREVLLDSKFSSSTTSNTGLHEILTDCDGRKLTLGVTVTRGRNWSHGNEDDGGTLDLIACSARLNSNL